MRIIKVIPALVFLILLFGCSGGGSNPIAVSPIEPVTPKDMDSLPVIAFDGTSATGLMGSWTLSFSEDMMSAELTPVRTPSLGEAFIVSGQSFFVTRPCLDCLKIDRVALDRDGNVALGFTIRHPFDAGDPSQPPSGKNRLDLDLFDVALVAQPVGKTPTTYDQLGTSAYTGFVLNADGYTQELSGVTEDQAAVPFKICYENASKNRFRMGTTNQYFYLLFSKAGLNFQLYLTFGYGASATFLERLTPTYFVPEFNKKAAWKVKVDGSTWYGSDPATIKIDILDWNHGIPVSTNFPDKSNPSYLSATSNISSVTVYVPGMTDDIVTAATTDTQTNGWDNPITYNATFSNENGISQGDYWGIVKVLDSRTPGAAGESNSLIHTPNGVTLQQFTVPEFATYQAFKAVIAPPCGPITGSVTSPTCPITGVKDDDTVDFRVTASSANGGNPIVSYEIDYDYDGTTFDVDDTSTDGVFENAGPYVNPNCPDPTPVTYTVAFRATDSCYHPNTTIFATCDVTVDICCGPITGDIISPSCPLSGISNHQTVDFEVSASSANGGVPITLYEADWSYDGLAFNAEATSPNGTFINGGPFNNPNCPGSGDPATVTVAFRATDSCNPPNQTIFTTCDVTIDQCDIWALTWGGTGNDEGQKLARDTSGNIYLAGYFENTVDLDPSDGIDEHVSNGGKDIFLSKFDSKGLFLSTFSIGGEGDDICKDIFIDGSNNIFISGYFTGTADFDPGIGTVERTSVNITPDAFIAKYDSNCNLLWVSAWGGDSDDSAQGVVTGSGGILYVTGYFNSTVDFDPGAGVQELTSAGLTDMFLSRLDTSGNYLSATRIGSWGYDESESIVADSSGNVYVTGGFFGQVDFDHGAGTDQHTSNGDFDTFLIKYDSSGNYVWGKSWGAAAADKSLDMICTPANNLLITGYFQETVDFDPDPVDVVEATSVQFEDVYISKFDTSGEFISVITWGGNKSDVGRSIAFNGNSVAVTGYFGGTVDFDTGGGTENQISAGGSDIFTSKFTLDTLTYEWALTVGAANDDFGSGVTIDNDENVYTTGGFALTVDFDPGPGADNKTSNGAQDAFLMKSLP